MVIQVERLSKQYGINKVLDEINVNLAEGVIYGLVGINGCGKTTLMRCICGFTHPSSGKVTVLGKRIGTDCDFAPSTGIIIEMPGFLPHHSARRNLSILAGVGGKADSDRIDQVIRMVGLDPVDKKNVGKFSLGMYQRLGIAQAIMEDPQILILDEPFNGLDKQGVAEIHSLLQSLKAQRKCILLASHSAVDIAQACDVVWEMKNGKLYEQGSEAIV
ncbi:MAG: ATP-binding cassette domain-containing protein [Clostridia bacterium]